MTSSASILVKSKEKKIILKMEESIDIARGVLPVRQGCQHHVEEIREVPYADKRCPTFQKALQLTGENKHAARLFGSVIREQYYWIRYYFTIAIMSMVTHTAVGHTPSKYH